MLGIPAPSPDSRLRPCSRLTHPGSTPASTACMDHSRRACYSVTTRYSVRVGTQESSTTTADSRPNTMPCEVLTKADAPSCPPHAYPQFSERRRTHRSPSTGGPGMHHTQGVHTTPLQLLDDGGGWRAWCVARPRGHGVWARVWCHTCRRVSSSTSRSPRLHTAGTPTSPSLTTRPQCQTSYGT